MPDKPVVTCFIDTNIWLYSFIEGDDTAKAACAKALIQATDPVVSTQVINEVCVNLLRRARFAEEDVRRLIESFYARYQVAELSRLILLTASELRQRYSLSFWDSTIIASALSAGVPVLYSEDMQNGLLVEERLRVRNPFAAA